MWECLCSCGNKVLVCTAMLRQKEKKSCGCKTKAETSGTHGMCGTPTHNTWRTMIERCTKEYHHCYERYKDKQIDPKWMTFEGFYEDMGERPEGTTLDRYPDRDGGYSKENCRWATFSEQEQNKNPSKRNKNSYPGIFESGGKFCARIRYNGQREYLGTFPTALDAAMVYDKRGREIFKDAWVSVFTEDEYEQYFNDRRQKR